MDLLFDMSQLLGCDNWVEALTEPQTQAQGFSGPGAGGTGSSSGPGFSAQARPSHQPHQGRGRGGRGRLLAAAATRGATLLPQEFWAVSEAACWCAKAASKGLGVMMRQQASGGCRMVHLLRASCLC